MGETNKDNSAHNDEEPILNLEEGPWPGPVEREVKNGEIRFGLNRISDFKSLRVRKHKKGRGYFRTVEATIDNNSIVNERWDYKAEVSVTEQGKGLVRGICVKGSRLEDYSWNIRIHDASYELSQHILPFLAFFGVDNKEQIHWITQFVGFPGAVIDGFQLNNRKRPFIYAVPLKGIQVGQQHQSLSISDLGISGGESENTFYPIILKLNLQDQEPWKKDTPKAFGVVMANSLLEAEHLALERARLTADLVNYSIRIAASHWEDRRESFPLDWSEQYANKQISLYDFVLIREVESVKGWVRVPHLISDNEPVSFDNVNNRLLDFFRRFSTVFTLGDVHTQTGKRTIVENEKRLISGIQRCLHWYGVSSQEEHEVDKFLSLWIALESIVDCISYPGVFDGNRASVKPAVKEQIKNINFPKSMDINLTVSADMIERRLLASDWPLPTRLRLFSRSFGINLQKDDIEMVRKLGILRGKVLHTGNHDIILTKTKIRALEYLIERLIMAASVCAYKKLEDNQKHLLQWLPLGPEGGAAPLKLDGKLVNYDFYVTNLGTDNEKQEWSINGYIYDKDNSQVTR